MARPVAGWLPRLKVETESNDNETFEPKNEFVVVPNQLHLSLLLSFIALAVALQSVNTPLLLLAIGVEKASSR